MSSLSDRLRWQAERLGNKFSADDELFQLLTEAAAELDQRPKGKWGYRWKVHGDGRRPTELFPCSECGFESLQATNYCGNCGAYMDIEDGE